MLRVIATESVEFIEAIIRIFSPEKKQSNHLADTYRKENTIFLYLKKAPSHEVVTWIASEFLPERLYFPYLGYSVDMIHEIGDVILPNVFFWYSSLLEKNDINKENRENFISKQVFIENFQEQKDYYVEDFGLSLWWILVSWAPKSPSLELHEKLMYAYEWDVYVSDDIFPALDTLSLDEVPTMILVGIQAWKTHSKYGNVIADEIVIKNIITTIDFLEAESEEEA